MMIKRLVTVVALMSLALCAFAQKMHPIQKLDDMFVKGFKMNDAKAMASVYAPNALLLPPNTLKVAGRDMIQKEFEGFLAMYTVQDVMVKDVWYETNGNLSTSTGWLQVMAKPKSGGDVMTFDIRGTSIAKKVGKDWWYVSVHASMPVPAAAAMAMKDK